MVIENIYLGRLRLYANWSIDEFYSRWGGKAILLTEIVWIVPGTIGWEC